MATAYPYGFAPTVLIHQVCSNGSKLRATIDRWLWDAMAVDMAEAFGCEWDKNGATLGNISGRKLCVLAWALSAADSPLAMPTIIKNWVALREEDRWWLYGMALISQGWRKSLTIALSDYY